jgi:CRP/FNR family nitrogen fixation transcriptional regulator
MPIQTLRVAPAKKTKAFQASITPLGMPMLFPRGAEIYGESQPAEYLYKVLGGAVRTYRVLDDGRRQVDAFCQPGDVFGLEIGEEHTSSADAIVECQILVIKRSALVELAARDNRVACQLWSLTAAELQRAQHHTILMVKTAQERIISFLLEMAM